MGIISDIVENAQLTVDSNGVTCKRIFTVTDLPEGSNTLYLATLVEGIPRYGTAHPTIPGIYAQQIQPEPLAKYGKTAALVTATYGWQLISGPQSNQIQISTSSVTVDANNDGNGNFYTANYADPNSGQTVSNMVQIRRMVPHTVLTYTRNETSSPLTKSQLYTSCTNQDNFQGSNNQGLWLCRNIGGQAITSLQWRVSYVFEFAPEGWVAYGFYTDKNTRVTPTDIISQSNLTAAFQAASQNGYTGNKINGIYISQPKQLAFATLGIPNLY